MENKFREITLMNSILCIFVVLIHLTSSPLINLQYGSMAHIAVFIANKALCFCVPAFIFLSGFKLFNKYCDGKLSLKRFYGGRIKKIVVPYLISLIPYFWFFYDKKWVSTSEIPRYIFLGTLAAHFYYIIVAVQLYFIFPFIKELFKKYPLKFTAVSFVLSVCCAEFFDFRYMDRFFGTYIWYFALGMLAAHMDLKAAVKKHVHLTLCLCAITGIVHLFFVYRDMGGGFVYRMEDILHIVYITLAIFLLYGLCLTVKDKFKPIHICAEAVSRKSFSIYLYHVFVIFWMQYNVYPYYSITIKYQLLYTSGIVFGLIFVYCFIRKPKKFRNE